MRERFGLGEYASGDPFKGRRNKAGRPSAKRRATRTTRKVARRGGGGRSGGGGASGSWRMTGYKL